MTDGDTRPQREEFDDAAHVGRPLVDDDELARQRLAGQDPLQTALKAFRSVEGRDGYGDIGETRPDRGS